MSDKYPAQHKKTESVYKSLYSQENENSMRNSMANQQFSPPNKQINYLNDKPANTLAEYVPNSNYGTKQSLPAPGEEGLIYDLQTSTYRQKLHNDRVEQQKHSLKQTYWRWVMLFMVSYYFFVNFFMQQVVPSLQSQYISKLGIDSSQFNLCMSMQALPNIVLPLLVAPIVSKFGQRATMVFYTIIMIVGWTVVYIGIVQVSFSMEVIGTTIYGIGAYGSVVVFNSFVCFWFSGNELSTALAFINALQYFGQTFCSIIMPDLYNKRQELKDPFLCSLIIMISSFGTMMLILILDIKAEKYDADNNVVSKNEADDHNFSFKSMKNFGVLFWLVNVSTLVAFGCLQYNNNTQQLLQQEYGLSNTIAGYWIALYFLIQLPFTPLIGFYTDKRGKRSEMFTIGSLINCAQFIVFILVPVCPAGTNQHNSNSNCNSLDYIVPLVLGGLGNSFFGAVNAPMIALTVEQKDLNLAYGVYEGFMQLGMSLAPFAMGYLLDLSNTAKNGYQLFFYFSLFLALLQLITGLGIWIYDSTHKNLLQATEEVEGHIEEIVDVAQMKKVEQSVEEKEEVWEFVGIFSNIASIALSSFILSLTRKDYKAFDIFFVPVKIIIQISVIWCMIQSSIALYSEVKGKKNMRRVSAFMDYVSLNILFLVGIFCQNYISGEDLFGSSYREPHQANHIPHKEQNQMKSFGFLVTTLGFCVLASFLAQYNRLSLRGKQQKFFYLGVLILNIYTIVTIILYTTFEQTQHVLDHNKHITMAFAILEIVISCASILATCFIAEKGQQGQLYLRKWIRIFLVIMVLCSIGILIICIYYFEGSANVVEYVQKEMGDTQSSWEFAKINANLLRLGSIFSLFSFVNTCLFSGILYYLNQNINSELFK